MRMYVYSLSQRVHKVRKKIEQRRMLMAQAEVRQTRTRRQTQKPDYVYNDEPNSDASIPTPFSLFSADLLFLDSRMMVPTIIHIKMRTVVMKNMNNNLWMKQMALEKQGQVLLMLLPDDRLGLRQ